MHVTASLAGPVAEFDLFAVELCRGTHILAVPAPD